MLNAERYKDVILEICKADGRLALSNGNVCRCGFISCKKCEFNGEGSCMAETMKWLLEEYKEPIKLSRLEYYFLDAFPEKGDLYLARDKDGVLCMYLNKPAKEETSWYDYESDCLTLDPSLFQFIKWTDEEPYNVQEILKNCEETEDE